MSILYSGGLWSVFLITGVLCGYIWALNGPRWAYKALLFMALLVIIGALLLPGTHVFRVRIIEGLNWWKWAIAVAIPVWLYASAVRWIKKKADARDDP